MARTGRPKKGEGNTRVNFCISLPPEVAAKVRVRAAAFPNVSAYFADVVRRDKKVQKVANEADIS